MYPQARPILTVAGFLLLTTLLWVLWVPNASLAGQDPDCGGDHHLHDRHQCHVHCNTYPSGYHDGPQHGQNCSVNNPRPNPDPNN